jgi:hypothetical protein
MASRQERFGLKVKATKGGKKGMPSAPPSPKGGGSGKVGGMSTPFAATSACKMGK